MTYRSLLIFSLALTGTLSSSAQSPQPAPTATTSAPASAAVSAANAPAATSTAEASSSTPSASPAGDKPPASSAASDESSPELLKEARREGFKPKKRNGVTQFCYSDATLGTRFETEKCYTAAQMQMVIEQRTDVRNSLRQPGACGGSCNGH